MSQQNTPDSKGNNLQYLQNRLYYLGFGDQLNSKLEAAVKEKQDRFQIDDTRESKSLQGSKTIDFKIDFSKGNQPGRDGNDIYFLNRYTATLNDPKDSEKSRTHTFLVENGKGVSTKEAFNLLDGRPVKKELKKSNVEKFTTWL